MLKKSTLHFALFFTYAKIISAQTLSIGPMIGGNVSTFTAISNNKGLIGLSLGGFANYSVNDHFGLGLKVFYAQLGTTYNTNSEHERLNYIQVPITAVYYFAKAGNQIRPKVFAGMYLASLINATNKNGNKIVGTDGKST